MILNLASASPPLPRPPMHQAELMQLQEMGFPRSPVAEELLIKHSNKLEVVVNELLARPEQGRCVRENQSPKKKRGLHRRAHDEPYPVLPPISLDVPVPRLNQPFQLYDLPRTACFGSECASESTTACPCLRSSRLSRLSTGLVGGLLRRAYDVARNKWQC